MIYRFTTTITGKLHVITIKKDQHNAIIQYALSSLYGGLACGIPQGFQVYYVAENLAIAHQAMIEEFMTPEILIEECPIEFDQLYENGGYYTQDYFQMQQWAPFEFNDVVYELACL